jgi:hypothetical protein
VTEGPTDDNDRLIDRPTNQSTDQPTDLAHAFELARRHLNANDRGTPCGDAAL